MLASFSITGALRASVNFSHQKWPQERFHYTWDHPKTHCINYHNHCNHKIEKQIYYIILNAIYNCTGTSQMDSPLMGTRLILIVLRWVWVWVW